MTDKTLPGIVATGASGFIGRNFVETYQNEFQIFAIARRSQQEVGIARHKSITWFLTDVADRENIHDVISETQERGGGLFYPSRSLFRLFQ